MRGHRHPPCRAKRIKETYKIVQMRKRCWTQLLPGAINQRGRCEMWQRPQSRFRRAASPGWVRWPDRSVSGRVGRYRAQGLKPRLSRDFVFGFPTLRLKWDWLSWCLSEGASLRRHAHCQRALKERRLVKSRVWSYCMKERNGGGHMQVGS